MRVTASHIVDWVNTNAKRAQADLPRLIRRLCFETTKTQLIAFPAGDSTYVPGWDGHLDQTTGNAWVPANISFWEMGCDAKIGAKANGDYQKRVNQTNENDRLNATFVFVTPRRWIKKTDWVTEQRSNAEWADVRAYDADDLEQWLEQSPSVALQFAEELGLCGDGVESLAHHWQCWSQQCKPVITADALLMDRTRVRNKLIQATQTEPISPIILHADSEEEAVAFAVATLMGHPELANQTLVVTASQGWRFVDANSLLKIVIVAKIEVATTPVCRDGLVIIIPQARGNLTGRGPSNNEVVLERPNVYEFEKALIAIGMEESDAKRNALITGRSWSVFRRQHATNPAIKRPHWLNTPQSASLSMLCLLGAWHSASEADRAIVARLAARPYDDVERDLRILSGLDDAPLLCIGAVWKSKSPLELLSLFGEQITHEQLGRFFSIAKEMLTTPDPQLELPEKDRYAAQIYGKVHPYSGLLFESICDALMKLAVRGAELPALQTLNIEDRVNRLIWDLLENADGERWLSLASYLPTLAEAAPDNFLKAIEKSLVPPNSPVVRLLTETGDSGLTGRCWHAPLLWALETLAWSPRRLLRVSRILAQLSLIPIKGNYGNKPSASLFALFRSWLPKTASSLSERIKVLDVLIEERPEIAFNILKDLTDTGPQTADQSARPKWRDDDAGAGHGVTNDERNEMIAAAKQRLIVRSSGNALRIAAIVDSIKMQESEQISPWLELIKPFTGPIVNEKDKEILRDALRKHINWQRNYSDLSVTELDELLCGMESLYKGLSPADPILCHRWLFNSHGLCLPNSILEQGWQAAEDESLKIRQSAITDIYQKQGLDGIESLILNSAEPGIIGVTLANIEWTEVNWVDWIIENGADFEPNNPMTLCISSLLRAALCSNEIVANIISCAERKNWDAAKLTRFLILARPVKETWQLVAACGTEAENAYWQSMRPNYLANEDDMAFVLQRLLLAQRPRTALNCSQYNPKRAKSTFFFSALKQFLAGYECDGRMIESGHLGKILEYLEQSGEIEQIELVKLEFSLFPLLRLGEEKRAKALFDTLMSDPEFFTELICISYPPENAIQEEVLADSARVRAKIARQILHACHQQPGTQADGTLDHDAFTQFIIASRELCRHADQLTMCDQTLGEIFAYAPSDEDGSWPFLPARELLDRPDMEEMRSGFYSGILNKRDIIRRSPFDGGESERNIANQYEAHAERIQNSHPNVAGKLFEIVRSYNKDSDREDINARLRMEKS